MNEKLNVQNLIELLAEKHGMDKTDAESFVKEFFQLIEESLESDKYVKIRGLGTFKLIDVESRESVNINTGERFEIQGHTKVSFTPEPTLRELINKPFSHFETVVLNDDTVLEDTPVENNSEEEDAAGVVEEVAEPVEEVAEVGTGIAEEPAEMAEIVSGITEKSAGSTEVVTETTDEPAETAEEITETIEESAEITEEKSAEEIIQTVEEPAIQADEPVTETPVEENQEDIVPTYEVPKSPEPPVDKPDSSTMKFFIGIVVLVVLLCVDAVTFMYYPDLFDRVSAPPTKETADAEVTKPSAPVALTDSVIRKDTTLVAKKDTVAEAVASKPVDVPEPVVKQEPPVTTPKTKPESTVATTETKKASSVDASKKENKKSSAVPFEPDSVNYKIVGTKTTYTIKEGETLTRVALRFYGTKALWPYIVKYNPDVIKNPDHVPYGTVVKIPELEKK